MNYFLIAIGCLITGCTSSSPRPYNSQKELSKELKEISGIVAVGKDIWAITDKPKAAFYRLDQSGNVLQEVKVKGIDANDVEAITSDNQFLYIADVGDNSGDREQRQVIKVPINAIPQGDKKVEVQGEVISFTFPGAPEDGSKKHNNFDCESLISYGDSLYAFTKDREDKETRLFSIPKNAGSYEAHYISTYNSNGLITDAALNQGNNELALIGYHKGHKHPFIIIFSNFSGNDFFAGKSNRIELSPGKTDWQTEGITYGNDGMMYFSCEGTKDVPATLYSVKREKIMDLNKEKKD